MARGGCQITTATSRIDARLETRLGAILSELMGTERQAARPRGAAAREARTRPRDRAPSPGPQSLVQRARAHGERSRVRGRGHAEPHGRHDPGGRRLRGRGRRPLPDRHRRGQADRGGGRRLLGRQAVPDAHRRHPRHHARRPRDPDAQRHARWRWATSCSAAFSTAPAGRSMASGELRCTDRVSLTGEPLNPLMRRAIRDPLDVGVRSINSLLSVGGGQRIGLFAGSGVGKSVLLGMMTRYTKADVTVVGLIGERGREVQDFVSNTLGPDGMRRAVVVATPADNPPLMRLHGAWLAHRHRRVFPRPRHEGAAAARFARRASRRRSAKSRSPSASRPRPRAIRPRCSRACRNWSSAPATAIAASARSPRSIPCSRRATIRTIRSPMPRARSSTGTSCCRAVWRRAACTRRSTSRRPSAAPCIRSRPASSSISRRASSRCTRPISRTAI